MADLLDLNTVTVFFEDSLSGILRLIVRSCFSGKEVFLRELIKCSSESLDKIRTESSNNRSKADVLRELFILIVPDEANNTLTIVDNGAGMTKAEMVNNLATAPDGTEEFVEDMQAGEDLNRIVEFVMGFYTAYYVADKVVMTTKHTDDEQYIWESDGRASFTVGLDTSGQQLGRGTKITLFLTEDQLEYLNEETLQYLVREYCGHISYPIYLKNEYHDEWQPINNLQPWLRRAEEVTIHDYFGCYLDLTGDSNGYLAVKHFTVESQPEVTAILFVHSIDIDLERSICLAEGHFIYPLSKDLSEQLIPPYLTFISGVVDCDPDEAVRYFCEKIPQEITENMVNKCIEMLLEIAEDKDKYKEFYKAFSNDLKLGITVDRRNSAKLADLLRYHSTKSGDEMTSLKEYVTGMKEGQKDIYYITGESKTALENSPFLERLKKKGYEVLFMFDDLDKEVVMLLTCYDGRKLVSVTKKGRTLCKVIKEILGDKVKDVVISDRIVDSPCYMTSNKTMEINPENGIMEELGKSAEADNNNKLVKDLVLLLFETALLSSGFSLDDPNTFSARIHRMLKFVLPVNEDEAGEDADMPALEIESNKESKMEELD